MNKVEAMQRIRRNYAILTNQVELQNASGNVITEYCESAADVVLSRTRGWNLINLNRTNPNHPAIDFLSHDGTVGVQATFRVTAVKFKDTLTELEKLLKKGKLLDLKEVHVVGLNCVNNATIQAWNTVPNFSGVQVKAYALNQEISNSSMNHSSLGDLDFDLGGLVSTSSLTLRSDSEEVAVIVAYLARRFHEAGRH